MNLVPKNAVLEWRSSKKGSAEETLYLTRWALDVPFFIECLKCCMDPGIGNHLVMMKQVQQRALELRANSTHTPTLELSDDSTWMDAVPANTPEEARVAGKKACAEAWGTTTDNINTLHVFEGKVTEVLCGG